MVHCFVLTKPTKKLSYSHATLCEIHLDYIISFLFTALAILHVKPHYMQNFAHKKSAIFNYHALYCREGNAGRKTNS